MENEIIKKIFNIKSSTIDEMKDLLSEVKRYKHEQLEKKIKTLEQELKEIKKAKKYGLVWEEKEERFDKETIWKLPVLEEIKTRNITQDNRENNILIEWDNYHTLSVLNYTHKGKIDVIYIDPPYNTGNNDFIYNDKIVDKEDKFRHSKWLSFMHKRLKLAKNLLSEKWVIFISIDDNEFAQLKLLCDEIFWSENSFWPIIWQKASGWWNSKKVVKWHEYLLCYSQKEITLTQKNEKHIWIDYKKSNNYIEKDWKIFFINDDVIRKVFWKYKEGMERRCEYEDLLIYKNQKIKKEIDELLEEWKYILKKNPKNHGKHFICRLEEIDGKRMKLYSIIFWIFNNEWKEDLVKLWLENQIFDYPKPLNLLKFILDTIDTKNSIILDFFAWSWTTWHAVLELNKEDWWNRKFILATNNENNICEEITYERIKRVMNGYTNQKWEEIEGLGWNLTYLKTDFIDKSNVNDDLRTRMVARCTELLCLKENIWVPVPSSNSYCKIFQRQDKYLAILYDMFYFDEFKKILMKLDIPVSVYVFSHYKLTKSDFEEIKNIEIEQIPDPILEVYETIF